MDQYYLCYEAFNFPPLDRRITREEFVEAVKFALDAGLKPLDNLIV